VLYHSKGLDPVDALGRRGPEAVRILDRASVEILVFGIVHMGALAPVGWHVIDLFGSTLLPTYPSTRHALISRHYATAFVRPTRRGLTSFWQFLGFKGPSHRLWHR